MVSATRYSTLLCTSRCCQCGGDPHLCHGTPAHCRTEPVCLPSLPGRHGGHPGHPQDRGQGPQPDLHHLAGGPGSGQQQAGRGAVLRGRWAMCCSVQLCAGCAALQCQAGGLHGILAALHGSAVCCVMPVMHPPAAAAAAAGCGTWPQHWCGALPSAQRACWPLVPKHRPLGMPPHQCRHLAAYA